MERNSAQLSRNSTQLSRNSAQLLKSCSFGPFCASIGSENVSFLVFFLVGIRFRDPFWRKYRKLSEKSFFGGISAVLTYLTSAFWSNQIGRFHLRMAERPNTSCETLMAATELLGHNTTEPQQGNLNLDEMIKVPIL